jgi:hypothetical protein
MIPFLSSLNFLIVLCLSLGGCANRVRYEIHDC